jgi:sugar lactone lactonase YvrE
MPMPRRVLLTLLLVPACGTAPDAPATRARTVTISADTLEVARGARRVGMITGLAQPESVVHDPEQDVYFISNMRGAGSDRNNGGYIVQARGADPRSMRIFVQGGAAGVTLNAPKGLVVAGDVLWVADIDLVRGFDRRTGAPAGEYDLRPLGATMLNALTVDADGVLYVTDTGIHMTDRGVLYPRGDRIFALRPDGAVATVAEGMHLELPNGIAWDARTGSLIVASFNPWDSEVYALQPDGAKRVLARGPGRFDGLQILDDGRIVTTSWKDHSVHVIDGDTTYRIATHMSTAADLGVDRVRQRLLVPLVLPGRVDILQLVPPR